MPGPKKFDFDAAQGTAPVAPATPVAPPAPQSPGPSIPPHPPSQPAAPMQSAPAAQRHGSAVAVAIMLFLFFMVAMIVAVNLILGASGIPMFGREGFDKNVMLPFGSWVLTTIVGGSKTRLGYWAFMSVTGPLFAIVLAFALGRASKK